MSTPLVDAAVLGPLTVQTLPPFVGPVSVSRVLIRGVSLARFYQGPYSGRFLGFSTDERLSARNI